ncbi:MAG TPA: hypothetical protein VK824_08520 [Planctomycetota bacterium]|nr:hypothetical protein [Planctomycetota bacterium]
MKRRKVGNIGLVFGNDTIRAAQNVDGRMIWSSVPVGDNAKKSLRQLISSAPFVGRNAVVGVEGHAVLVESIVLPPGNAKEARKVCTDRLKGDPLFSADKAFLGIGVETMPPTDGGQGSTLAIMAAMNRDRLMDLMRLCRDAEVNVQAVESSALAAWRAWNAEDLQVRLVRGGGHDLVLAGIGGKLLFCRIVDTPVPPPELRATVGRAASLLGAEAFPCLTTAGVDEAARQEIASALGIEVKLPGRSLEDAAAVGLATEGAILADFTPPEERVLREKRHVRKTGVMMAAACGVLVLAAGALGTQRISSLHERQTTLEQQRDITQADKQQLDELNTELAREEANEAVIVEARPGHRMSTLFALISANTSDAISIETAKVSDVEDPGFASAMRDAKNKDKKRVGPVPRQLEVRLNGLARTGLAVRQFADALLSTGAFADVRVEASERVLLGVGMDGERFRIYARAETH